MSPWLQDVRYALRMLRKNPGFTAIAVIALALGIGATTTIFSFVDAVLLRPMAYKDLHQLAVVWTVIPKQNITQSSVSPADFLDWAAENRVFSDMAASSSWEATLTGQGNPELLQASVVTPNYFNVLGVNAALGRALVPADAAGESRVVVLAYNFWKQRLGANANIVGKSLTLNGQNYEVVGVMPQDVDSGEDLWRPLVFTPAERVERGNHYLYVTARLNPGVSVREADAEMKTIAARLEQQYPATNTGATAGVELLRENLTFGTRQYVLTLMGAAIFVLLLACANVANLQLARALARQKEMAVRAALGASRWRVVRQILVESTVVACGGGVLGVLLAAWGIDLTRASIPASVMRVLVVLRHIQLDARVLIFTLAVSVASGILSGLVAALHASRTNVNDALKEGGRSEGAGSGHRPVRAALVVTEVALALVLLVSAGLMVRGFRNLLVLNQGYEGKGVLTMRVNLVRTNYPEASKRVAFYDQVLRGLESVPGVEAAASTSSLPTGGRLNQEFRVEGRPEPAPDQRMLAASSVASADYFRAMQIPVIRGRAFTAQDGPQTPPVVIISAEMARQYWQNSDPLGQRIRIVEEENSPWLAIVGVVGDVRRPFDHELRPAMYAPIAQKPPYRAAFVMRTAGDPMALVTAARQQVRQADPQQAIYDIRSLDGLLGDQISGVQIASDTMSIFALVALALAGAGIYAVMAYAVVQRTHEIGVRMALGASRLDTLKMIVGYACKLAGIGLGIGAVIAIGVSRALSATLFGVLELDVATFAALVVLLGAVAAVAGYIPAQRAAKTDPMVALRYE